MAFLKILAGKDDCDSFVKNDHMIPVVANFSRSVDHLIQMIFQKNIICTQSCSFLECKRGLIDMTAQEKFYTNLSVAMTQKGLSAIDLSKALAVPPATVYRWLRNEGKVGGVMPQPRTLKAIAESLGVNSEWLAGNDEHMHTAPDPLDTGSKHIQSHAMKILATLLRSNDDKIHKEAVAYMMEILSNHLE